VKWLALGICLILVMPVSAYLRRNPLQSPKVWMLVGFLPFGIHYFHLYMAIDSAALWGGYVKGVEVSILDLIVLTLYFSTPNVKQPLPFRFVMAFYFLMVLLSAFQAWQPESSLFYPWQLARMFLVYATVTKGCADPRVTPAIMRGMAAGLMMETAFAIWQRFGMGMTQTGGTEGHQNLLGVMSHLVILPFFALLLAGRRGPLPVVVTVAGAFVIVSTASRGTIGLASFGVATIFVLSAARKWTSLKGRVLLIGVVAMAILVPAVTSSFQERFAKVPIYENGYDERAAYLKAAGMMLADHPLGIGANHFAVIGNIEHYYEKAGVDTYASGLAGNVHNFYYLTAAETGYQGLIALLLLLVRPLIVAFRCGWRNVGDYRGDLLIGLGVALLAVYFHSWLEWSLATFSAEYLLAIAIGLVAGNAQQLGYWSVRPLSAVRPLRNNNLGPVISSAKSITADLAKPETRSKY
jgi:O-antigen ligase